MLGQGLARVWARALTSWKSRCGVERRSARQDSTSYLFLLNFLNKPAKYKKKKKKMSDGFVLFLEKALKIQSYLFQ